MAALEGGTLLTVATEAQSPGRCIRAEVKLKALEAALGVSLRWTSEMQEFKVCFKQLYDTITSQEYHCSLMPADVSVHVFTLGQYCSRPPAMSWTQFLLRIQRNMKPFGRHFRAMSEGTDVSYSLF